MLKEEVQALNVGSVHRSYLLIYWRFIRKILFWCVRLDKFGGTLTVVCRAGLDGGLHYHSWVVSIYCEFCDHRDLNLYFVLFACML